MADNNNLIVYCEYDEGRVADVSLELLTKGRVLADRLGVKLEAIVIGDKLDGIENQIFPYGADTVYKVEDPRLFPYTSNPHAAVLIKLFREIKPQVCLMGATCIGRDLGGNIVATIVNPECRPQMATVREGVMKKEIFDANHKGEVVNLKAADYVDDTDFAVEIIDRHIEKSKVNIKNSPIIVAGGYGVGSKENFQLLFDLADTLGAEVGASRAAVDAGFIEHERQIGQTGVTVRPKLYIACGISGQIQHIAGMQESSIIISINNDPNAPINTIADYVITGDMEDIVPKLIKYYKKNSK